MKLLFLNIIMAVMLIGAAWLFDLRINVTPSLERGIYRLSDSPPARRDIASFCLSGSDADMAKDRGYLLSGSCPSGLRPLMKYLAALPSDKVIVSDNSISCCPQGGPCCVWSITPLAKDRLGRPLAAAPIEGIVPDGQALVLTSHKGGFDSRYYGFVPLDSLQKMDPLLVF